eukprot:SAG25_NODE_2302_length_1740_cov_0.937843_1_plen_105_part_10
MLKLPSATVPDGPTEDAKPASRVGSLPASILKSRAAATDDATADASDGDNANADDDANADADADADAGDADADANAGDDDDAADSISTNDAGKYPSLSSSPSLYP